MPSPQSAASNFDTSTIGGPVYGHATAGAAGPGDGVLVFASHAGAAFPISHTPVGSLFLSGLRHGAQRSSSAHESFSPRPRRSAFFATSGTHTLMQRPSPNGD